MLFDEDFSLFGTDYGTYAVRLHISLNDKEDAVIVWHNNSTLYPEWLPRWTGIWIIKKDKDGKSLLDEYGRVVKEKEIVFDIYNGRCGWYMFDKLVKKDELS